jgi:hypothetical protein
MPLQVHIIQLIVLRFWRDYIVVGLLRRIYGFSLALKTQFQLQLAITAS